MSDSDDGAFSRRRFLTGSAAATAALLVGAASCDSMCNTADNPTSGDDGDGESDGSGAENSDLSDWENVRAQFNVDPDLVHMSGMLLATHPRRVREAIEEYRRELNENPVDNLFAHWGRSEAQLGNDAEEWAMEAAGRYLEMDHAHIALTRNTTSGLAMVYNGLDVRADQEVVTGHWNHWSTEGSIDYAARKRGFTKRRAVLYDDLQSATADELVDNLIDEIDEQTRVVAVTWVHSTSGLKLPIGQIGARIEEINANRATDDHVIFCVDGVHGFGVEDATFADFNCHFFIAGCHKWLFGPRGTGIIAGAPTAWQHATPTIPGFSMGLTPGRRFTPGGFHAFEHRWALNEAFEFQMEIGKNRVQNRIHALADHLVEELAAMDHVDLRTPVDPDLRAGIVSFEVDGHGTYPVVDHLREYGVIASTTPEDRRVPRLTPGLLNDHDDVEVAVEAIAALG